MDEAEITVNEHIKRLMGQTLDDKFKETWSTLTPADLEKFVKHFAELIVKECIAKYNEYGIYSSDYRSFIIAGHNLKKHFGVEE